MPRLRLVLFTLFLIAATQAFAQCKECARDFYGCLTCVDTEWNAQILCTIIANGEMCYMDGFCEGRLGDRCFGAEGCVVHQADADPKQRLLGEWRLVSVEIERPKRDRRL